MKAQEDATSSVNAAPHHRALWAELSKSSIDQSYFDWEDVMGIVIS